MTTKRTGDRATTGGMYLLRMSSETEYEIWRRARSRAVLEGRTIRDVIMELLDRWAYEAGAFVKRPKEPKRKRK
jgi:hypothetical protein